MYFSITSWSHYTPIPQNHHTVVHVHEFFFLFTQSFHPLISSLPPPEPSACSLSVSLSPFSLLAQFVHYMPHMSEIIWHLSSTDCLISLSIMFSRSIHTVTKGKTFFFFLLPSSILMCKCPIVFSIPLPMDT